MKLLVTGVQAGSMSCDSRASSPRRHPRAVWCTAGTAVRGKPSWASRSPVADHRPGRGPSLGPLP